MYGVFTFFWWLLQNKYIEQVLEASHHTQQSTNYTVTYLPSRKLSKLDEPDMQDAAGESGTSS